MHALAFIRFSSRGSDVPAGQFGSWTAVVTHMWRLGHGPVAAVEPEACPGFAVCTWPCPPSLSPGKGGLGLPARRPGVPCP